MRVMVVLVTLAVLGLVAAPTASASDVDSDEGPACVQTMGAKVAIDPNKCTAPIRKIIGGLPDLTP